MNFAAISFPVTHVIWLWSRSTFESPKGQLRNCCDLPASRLFQYNCCLFHRVKIMTGKVYVFFFSHIAAYIEPCIWSTVQHKEHEYSFVKFWCELDMLTVQCRINRAHGPSGTKMWMKYRRQISCLSTPVAHWIKNSGDYKDENLRIYP